jgi:hypothetical protein
MRISIHASVCIMVALLAGTGCRHLSPRDTVAGAITEEYAWRYVHPLSDPVARLAQKGIEIPPGLLQSNRVTCVELIMHKWIKEERRSVGERRIIFENEARRPPNDGMVTGVDHARNIGLYYPVTLSQPEVEVRVNYFNDFGDDFVAVHVVVPNPLLVKNGRR